MIALVLCLLAVIVTYWATKRSLAAGLLAVTATGYFYGILRANLMVAASHFIFDSSLVGLYVAFGSRFFEKSARGESSTIQMWAVALVLWPALLCLAPFQPLVVSLVGLRGSVFFLPLLLIGCRLRHKDIRQFTFGLAVLNILALGMGVLEYFEGIERFFPRSDVTLIMYMSGDVAGGHYRLPSLFTSAHAYAGTMIYTLPFLFGAWAQSEEKTKRRLFMLCGMFAAFAGVLLASTRTNVVVAGYLIIVALMSGKLSIRKRIVLALVVAIVGFMAFTNERFGRFKSLADSEMVTDRIAGSVNRSFFEILTEYPMGNGLGGGGTSMPYFLQGRIQHPLHSENEYARILGEQGVIGLLIWVGFALWCIAQRKAFLPGQWLPARRMIWFLNLFIFLSSALGNGLLTAIPGTFFFLLGLGWIVVPPAREPLPLSSALPRWRRPVPRAVLVR